jgi:ankyrin repeat protein
MKKNPSPASRTATIIDAVMSNDLEALQHAIAMGADINARASFNNTPLILAATFSKIEIVRLLVAYGADLDAANDSGITALIASITRRDTALCTRLLVEAGADAAPKNKWGETALTLAQKLGQMSSVRALTENRAEKKPRPPSSWLRKLMRLSTESNGTAAAFLTKEAPLSPQEEGI